MNSKSVGQRDGHRSAGLHSRARQQFGYALDFIAELGSMIPSRRRERLSPGRSRSVG